MRTQLLDKYHRFETMPHKFVHRCASLCIAFLCSLFSWCLKASISMAWGQLPTDSFFGSPVDPEPVLTRYVMFLTLASSHSQYSRSPCCVYQGLRCAAFKLLLLFATKCHLHLSLRQTNKWNKQIKYFTTSTRTSTGFPPSRKWGNMVQAAMLATRLQIILMYFQLLR